MSNLTVQELGERLAEKGFYTGGPVEKFEAVGRHQLVWSLENGLAPYHKLLDFGCGPLRGGYWFIRFLDPECYFGIEPFQRLVNAGLQELFDRSLLDFKRPRFDHNDSFDIGVFGEKFDFIMMRSIWTHAGPGHIQKTLDGFVEHTNPEAVLLTTYVPPASEQEIHTEDKWVRAARFTFEWLEQQCRDRGLAIQDQGRSFAQRWLRVERMRG